MHLDQHKNFAGYDVDSKVLITAEIYFVLASVSQISYPKYDISCDSKVKAAVKIIDDETAALSAKKRPNV